MPDFDVTRSVQFVSLDTHPANNVLVVTYEILIIIHDRFTRRELARRNKRDQLQINISALDNLNEFNWRGDKLLINLQELSTEVVRKCPMLLSERQNLEDIQLHLLYLIKRRQSQLLAQSEDNNLQNSERPPSSASLRLRSSQKKTGRTGYSANSRAPKVSLKSNEADSSFGDVYNYLQTKELLSEPFADLDDYMNQLDQHLDALESSKVDLSTIKVEKLDSYLEDLYGNNDERLFSITIIRHLSKDHLSEISSNRLLFCAMLRTIRDSRAEEFHLCESIFYCLLRLTSFDDIYKQVFIENDSVDLIRVTNELLADHVANLKANNQLKHLLDQYYYTNSILMLTLNLFQLDAQTQIKVFAQQSKQILTSLTDLVQLGAKHIARDLFLSSKPINIISMLSRTILILRQLSMFKEFVSMIRVQQPFLDSLMNLINTLQLSRPGSGTTVKDGIVSDKQTMNDLYELEMNTFEFINDIMLDSRLKFKLIKRNLLKSVLRNLVVFLASRRSNAISPYHRSSVLITPFKCLFELSCEEIVKAELFKSKIIMKCLLEYLLSITIDLKSVLDLMSSRIMVKDEKESASSSDSDPLDQIVIEPNDANQYIVSLWINLSARKEATIYSDTTELRQFLDEYIELAFDNLRIFLSILIRGRSIVSKNFQKDYLMIYLHMKLLRNLTQFLVFQEPITMVGLYARWVEKIEELTSSLMAKRDNLTPLSVESIAILTNLLSKHKSFGQSISLNLPGSLTNLIERMFLLHLGDFNAENDDLLLASILFFGNLVRCQEICGKDRFIYSKALMTNNYILESKSTDRVFTLSSLFLILQLTNHVGFLNECSGSNSSKLTERLVDCLTNLILNGDATTTKFTIIVLNRLRQLENSKIGSIVIYKKRFASYNEKWLNAINSSRENLILNEREGIVERLDDINELRTLEDDSTILTENPERVSSAFDIEQDDENEDDDIDFEAPDLNVIDSNSMIKHLTSRRELRSQWLGR